MSKTVKHDRLTKKFDPRDPSGLNQFFLEGPEDCAIEVDVSPIRYVSIGLSQKNPKLTIKQARKVARFLNEACDQLEAGRGTIG